MDFISGCKRCGMALVAVFAAGAWQALADLASDPHFVTMAEKEYRRTRESYLSEKSNPESAIEFARAAFDWADVTSKNSDREKIANEGIAACKGVVTRDKANAGAHYYLALNLGQLARTKLLGALALLDEMEKELTTALSLDARFDHAGPDRSIGILYRDAPGWPTSVGSRSKARVHLRKAVELEPSFPENQICLLEAYAKWNQKAELGQALPRAEEAIQKARPILKGEMWEASWRDWDARMEEIRKNIPKSSR